MPENMKPETVKLSINDMCALATISNQWPDMTKTLWLWECKGVHVTESNVILLPDGTEFKLPDGQVVKTTVTDEKPVYRLTPAQEQAEQTLRSLMKDEGYETVELRKVDSVLLTITLPQACESGKVEEMPEKRKLQAAIQKANAEKAKAEREQAKAAISEGERREQEQAELQERKRKSKSKAEDKPQA